MSHKQLILAELKKGRMLSKQEMLAEFKCWNSGGRISELRKDGHRIDHIMVPTEDKTAKFAKYFLVAPNVRRVF